MDTETNSDNKIWLILQKIKELSMTENPERVMMYSIPIRKGGDTAREKEMAILRGLNALGAIKLISESSPTSLVRNKKAEQEVYFIPIAMMKERFAEIYQFHQEKQKGGKAVRPQKEVTVLSLEQSGDFWREPKIKYCYKMGEKSCRHKIIRHLVNHEGYQQTLDISLGAESKSKESTRAEIGKINSKSKNLLEIKGNVIEGKKGSGYKISAEYKIKIIP